MDSTVAFLNLIRKLQLSRSSFKRMKTLSEIWQLVSQLTPEQRAALAVDLGMESGDSLFDRFVSSPGTHSNEISRWADTLFKSLDFEQFGPLVERHIGKSEAAAIIAGLKSRQRDPSSTLDADRPLTIPLEEPPPGPQVPPPPSESDEVVPFAEVPPEISEEELAAESKGDGQEVLETVADEPVGDSMERETADQVQKERDKSDSASVPTVETAESVEQEIQPASAVELPFKEAISPPPLAEPENLPRVTESAALSPLQLEALDSSLSRFKWVSASLKSSVTVEEVKTALTALPPGWMRRRSLCRYLETSPDAAFSDLLDLILENLSTRVDYLWFVNSLLKGNPDVTEKQIEMLLESAPSDLMRQKVEHRLASSSTRRSTHRPV